MYPELHVIPQLGPVPPQVVVPFVVVGQAAHEVGPHDITLVLLAQAPLQT